jgi:hypothetical protein
MFARLDRISPILWSNGLGEDVMDFKISHDCPPIPMRNFDFCAYDNDTMDVCDDEDCSCRHYVVRGFGSTAEEAIQEFVRVLLDKRDISVSEMMI